MASLIENFNTLDIAEVKNKRELDKKSSYMKRCILYLLENGNDHIDKVDQYVDIDLSFLDDEYTEEKLETLLDNDIIQLAHITKVCQIFHNVKDEIDNPRLQWEYDDNEDYIYFSEKIRCFEDCSCHRRYAYIFAWDWSDMISYTDKNKNTFSIDTPVKDAYCFMRIN